MVDHVGQQFGNYRLLRLLGQGGFAEVYLGKHVYLNNLAAIKLLHAHLVGKDAEHFLAEAKTLVDLVHPNSLSGWHRPDLGYRNRTQQLPHY